MAVLDACETVEATKVRDRRLGWMSGQRTFASHLHVLEPLALMGPSTSASMLLKEYLELLASGNKCLAVQQNIEARCPRLASGLDGFLISSRAALMLLCIRLLG